MATKNQQLPDVQVFIQMLFPDGKERDELLRSALSRLHPETPKGDRFSAPINVGDIVIEMLWIRRTRELVRLILAMQPKRTDDVHAILGVCNDASLTEVAHVFGVSENTISKDWLPAGMPIN